MSNYKVTRVTLVKILVERLIQIMVIVRYKNVKTELRKHATTCQINKELETNK